MFITSGLFSRRSLPGYSKLILPAGNYEHNKQQQSIIQPYSCKLVDGYKGTVQKVFQRRLKWYWVHY